MTLLVYHFSHVSGEYLGSGEADISPLEEGVYLLPAHSTAVPPDAEVGPGESAVWNGERWEILADHRGETIWLEDGSSLLIDTIGPVPINASQTAPPPSLAEARASRISAITTACSAAIINGLDSAALGISHRYPTTPTDQLNLTANVVASLLPGISSDWTTPQLCADLSADLSGVWSYRLHTAAQIQQAGQDIKEAIAALLLAKAVKVAEIEAATAHEAIEAIIW